MQLELRIIGDPCPPNPKQRRRMFGEAGGTIGRSPDSYWVLPDPQNYVSGRHCDIEFRDGSFWLWDRSRNGVYLNHSHRRIAHGEPTPLMDGDRLSIGAYEIVVRVTDAPDTLREGRRHRPVDAADQDDAHAQTRVPMELPVPRRSGKRIAIDRASLVEAGLLPSAGSLDVDAKHSGSAACDALLHAASDGPAGEARLVLVTSAVRGEGKTPATLDLAVRLATEKHIRVLVVDADLAKRRLTIALGLGKDAGLRDVLRDESIDLESLTVATDIDGLDVLPAGRNGERALSEELTSERVALLARLLAARGGVVLIDSPPLLSTHAVRVLASAVQQVLLVTRRGVTLQPKIFDAISRLGQDKPITLLLDPQAVGHELDH